MRNIVTVRFDDDGESLRCRCAQIRQKLEQNVYDEPGDPNRNEREEPG